MIGTLLGGLAKTVGKVVDDVHTSEEERRLADLKAFEAETRRLEVTQRERLKQAETTLQDAKSANIYQAGWRPTIGWVCAAGFAYSVLIRPLLAWISPVLEIPVPPVIDTGVLMSMMGALLGIGGMRSWEKAKGVQDRH